VRLPGRDRLFAELDAETLEFVENGHRGVNVPAFVGVDSNRTAVPLSNRGDRLDLFGGGSAPEFDLEDRVIADFGDFSQRRFRIGDADRERRDWRERGVEPEKFVDGLAEILTDEIVEGEIQS